MSKLTVNTVAPVDTPRVNFEGVQVPSHQGVPLASTYSPTFSGTPTSPTPAPGSVGQQVVNCEFLALNASPSTEGPSHDDYGVLTPTALGYRGVSTKFAREDHRHPPDTFKAPLISPDFSGTPTAPTRPKGDRSASLATTAFACPGFSHNSGTGSWGYDMLPSGLIFHWFTVSFSVPGFSAGDIPASGTVITTAISSLPIGPSNWIQAQITAVSSSANFTGSASIASLTLGSIAIRLEEWSGGAQTCTVNVFLIGI
jgi:hypothetical protein